MLIENLKDQECDIIGKSGNMSEIRKSAKRNTASWKVEWKISISIRPICH